MNAVALCAVLSVPLDKVSFHFHNNVAAQILWTANVVVVSFGFALPLRSTAHPSQNVSKRLL